MVPPFYMFMLLFFQAWPLSVPVPNNLKGNADVKEMTTIVTYTLTKYDIPIALYSAYIINLHDIALLIVALKLFLFISSSFLDQPQKHLQPTIELRNLQKLKTHNIKIHRTKYLRYKIKNVNFPLFCFLFYRVAKMMHYRMYCNTQASESFFFPHTGRFFMVLSFSMEQNGCIPLGIY